VRKAWTTRWKTFASHYLLTLLQVIANCQNIGSLPCTLMKYNQRIFDDILICVLLLRRVIQQRSTQKSKMQMHWHLSGLCAVRSLSLSSLAWCRFPCCDVAVKLQNTRRELRCDHFHHSARRGVCSVNASSSLQCFDKVYGEWFATNMLHAFNKTDKNLDNGKRLAYKRIRYFTLTQLAVLL